MLYTQTYTSAANIRRGFTLIELLVVVAIIGMLSSVVLAALGDARASARNAERKQNLRQVQTALELYYQDNGTYPVQTSYHGTSPGCQATAAGGEPEDNIIPGLVGGGYIGRLPVDPLASGSACYIYVGDASGYKFMAYLTVENETVSQGEPFSRCPLNCSQSWCTADSNSYAVYEGAWECS